MMTKVERIIYEEKMQAVRQAKREAKKEAKKEAEKLIKETSNSIAKSLLENGVSAELILNSIHTLTREDLNKMQTAI